jgi:hypothetical protein
VTRDVAALQQSEIDAALSSGGEKARALLSAGLIDEAVLHLQGERRVIALKRFDASVSARPRSAIIESLNHA